MEPIQFNWKDLFKVLLSIFTFGLVAPVLLTFREEKEELNFYNDDSKENYEMVVNQTEEEAKPMLSTVKRR